MPDLEKNKKAVLTLYETVFRNHDFSRLDEIMRDDYIQHNGDCPQGKAGFIRFFNEIFAGIPDFRYTMRRIVAEGDLVVLWSTTTGTHRNEWLGCPPTGNRLEYDAVDFFRMEDGLIAEHWDVADTLKLFTAIGRVKS